MQLLRIVICKWDNSGRYLVSIVLLLFVAFVGHNNTVFTILYSRNIINILLTKSSKFGFVLGWKFGHSSVWKGTGWSIYVFIFFLKFSVVLPPVSPSLLCLLYVTLGLSDTWMYPVYVHVINLYMFLIFSVPLWPLSFKPVNVHKSTHPWLGP